MAQHATCMHACTYVRASHMCVRMYRHNYYNHVISLESSSQKEESLVSSIHTCANLLAVVMVLGRD